VRRPSGPAGIASGRATLAKTSTPGIGKAKENSFPAGPNYADNSYHVVTAIGVDASTVLDGFTITARNADGDDTHDKGGGPDQPAS
jgi:hypothetical protein